MGCIQNRGKCKAQEILKKHMYNPKQIIINEAEAGCITTLNMCHTKKERNTFTCPINGFIFKGFLL